MSDNLPRPPDWEEQLRKSFHIRIGILLRRLESKDRPAVARLMSLVDEQNELIEELRAAEEMQEGIIQDQVHVIDTLEAKVAWLEGNSHDP